MAKKWVLVVDDDPSMLMILQDALEHPQLAITTASDALQACIQAERLKPIVIITDINMPSFGDGSTILKRLREAAWMPKMPVIFMTGMELEDARKLLPAGDPTIGLMKKPVDLDLLRSYVLKLAGLSPS